MQRHLYGVFAHYMPASVQLNYISVQVAFCICIF